MSSPPTPGTVVVSREPLPVILEPHAYGPWLGTDITDAEDLTRLLVPFPPEDMEAYPVDRQVNNPKNEGAACVPVLLARGLVGGGLGVTAFGLIAPSPPGLSNPPMAL